LRTRGCRTASGTGSKALQSPENEAPALSIPRKLRSRVLWSQMGYPSRLWARRNSKGGRAEQLRSAPQTPPRQWTAGQIVNQTNQIQFMRHPGKLPANRLASAQKALIGHTRSMIRSGFVLQGFFRQQQVCNSACVSNSGSVQIKTMHNVHNFAQDPPSIRGKASAYELCIACTFLHNFRNSFAADTRLSPAGINKKAKIMHNSAQDSPFVRHQGGVYSR
jgi:hypothetical protein